MKVFRIEDGLPFERDPVDAAEMVRSGVYTYTDPNAQPGAPVETSGEVLARSARERKADSERAGFQQIAEGTAVRDAQKMEELNPAFQAQKVATAARAAAVEAQRRADATGLSGVANSNITKLKADAVEAEKRAKEAESLADKEAKESAVANKVLADQQAATAKKAASENSKR